ncbi:MAG TPA: pyruvate dehydrogenase (acetyl-transferring), homodimeric type [Acidimicrobiales bacterium]|nr:pyruvate dehydrogenase (acetyl-transferring), homodimeric type [Acidimicrobiales bacterium]
MACLWCDDGRVIFDGFSHQLPDVDPVETSEWLDSFDAVVDARGRNRARFLLMKLLERARASQVGFPATVSTPYVNTIAADDEGWFPGDEYVERRIRAYIRWNAAVMVTRANTLSPGIGGHLATFASSASLYEVGFNHFFRGKDGGRPGDQVFFQGHAAPGIYARAFLEGRLDEDDLDRYRQELAGGGPGLASYPHPRAMPGFWEFPTVSMGLGPINAIYQARFNRYLLNRRLADTSDSRVWTFVGDGECDEPETLGALSLAAREQLDNLVFVVNCNLQRLDGPVRGNGKIIQELEAIFRGAGWNVVKVIWGSKWDDLLARDTDGVLLNKMNTTVDGEFQKYATESGAYIREHFFGPDPRLRKMVEHLSDEELQALPRGGHDYRKLYAAYKAATEFVGAPTAILAKTIKGWTLGPEIEARNATHQIKKMTREQLRTLRDRLYLEEEIPDEALAADLPPYYRPPAGSPAHEYLMTRRKVLDGPLPARVVRSRPLPQPAPRVFAEFDKGSGGRSVSTTMAFAVLLRNLLRDESVGRRVVPIIPDEARTFGLDALFKEVRIYASSGQLYTPVDAGLLLSYTEARDGQILEEGITEAGAMASFTAAATSYATHAEPMIPFYLFYSMFGFQRVGDLIWASGDARSRGFLMGATAGRTTLEGEGLQHDDGHSLLLASTVPSMRAYDPAFAYELAAVISDGVRRMYGPEQEDVSYYVTLYNENYPQPPLPEGDPEAIRRGILAGLYRFSPAPSVDGGEARRATILFSGTAWSAALEAQTMLAEQWGVSVDCWSATSYKALREEALSAERHNRLHPGEPARTPYVTARLADGRGPVVAVSDFMAAVPDQVARWVGRPFTVLGTDGWGRSDARSRLRRYFGVDAPHITVAVLDALARTGAVETTEVAKAISQYGIDPESPDPVAL